jgi:hypothetical protein
MHSPKLHSKPTQQSSSGLEQKGGGATQALLRHTKQASSEAQSSLVSQNI